MMIRLMFPDMVLMFVGLFIRNGNLGLLTFSKVAGIVAGSNDTGFIGVAPKAKLRAYKGWFNPLAHPALTDIRQYLETTTPTAAKTPSSSPSSPPTKTV